eukprot:1846546-Alexandrium_andersonii.AAC.1
MQLGSVATRWRCGNNLFSFIPLESEAADLVWSPQSYCQRLLPVVQIALQGGADDVQLLIAACASGGASCTMTNAQHGF